MTVRSYGARGDGTTDDTAAIQSAINAAAKQPGHGADVVFPAGTYRITRTLDCKTLGAGVFTGVNLRGAGPLSTTLRWDGPADGALLRIYNAKQYTVSGLHFLNGLGPSQQTIGADLTGSQNGTTTGSGIWEQVLFEGFNVGVRAGQWDNIYCTSELLFIHPMFYRCNVGLLPFGYNTLDITLMLPEFGGCVTGLKAHTANAVQVYGGSASGSIFADFHFLNAGQGAFVVSGFRSETANRCIVAQESGGLTVQGCNVSAITNQDKVAIELIGGEQLVLDASSIRGRVQYINGQCSMALRGCYIDDEVPYRVGPGGSGKHDGLRFSVQGCRNQQSAIWFADEVGYYDEQDVKHLLMGAP